MISQEAQRYNRHLKTRIVVSYMLLLVGLASISGCVFKPARVYFPERYGTICVNDHICVEETEQEDRATALYSDALAAVEAELGEMSYEPRFIFCSTQACFEKFGFDKAKAQTRGKVATVVGPRGWESYILRHELIHHWQADRLGLFGLRKMPEWLREGMAYDLSGDPRDPLMEPWDTYRKKFIDWYATLPADIDLGEALAEVD